MALEDATNPMQGVSGPSAYSKRTDLEYKSQSYGDGVAYEAAKSGAALATAPKSPLLSQAPQISAPSSPVTELFATSQRKNEAITAGIDMGAGPGANALQMTKITNKLSDSLAAMLAYDETGEIAVLYQEALARGN